MLTSIWKIMRTTVAKRGLKLTSAVHRINRKYEQKELLCRKMQKREEYSIAKVY